MDEHVEVALPEQVARRLGDAKEGCAEFLRGLNGLCRHESEATRLSAYLLAMQGATDYDLVSPVSRSWMVARDHFVRGVATCAEELARAPGLAHPVVFSTIHNLRTTSDAAGMLRRIFTHDAVRSGFPEPEAQKHRWTTSDAGFAAMGSLDLPMTNTIFVLRPWGASNPGAAPASGSRVSRGPGRPHPDVWRTVAYAVIARRTTRRSPSWLGDRPSWARVARLLLGFDVAHVERALDKDAPERVTRSVRTLVKGLFGDKEMQVGAQRALEWYERVFANGFGPNWDVVE